MREIVSVAAIDRCFRASQIEVGQSPHDAKRRRN